MSNSDNPKRGADFQKQVLGWFQNEYGVEFELEKKIPIGNPAKDHEFDIVDTAGTFAIECKRYTWTETGNVPSAKMGFTNEAAFYLSFLPDSYEKYIVMLKSLHPKRNESLAEYYFRTNHHLIGKIKVAEYDPEKNELRIVGQNDFRKDESYLVAIRSFLESKGLGYDTSLAAEIEKRKAGKHYTIQDHIRGMVYSMLTNQTKWYRVEPHLQEIDKLFYDYDPDKILSAEKGYFCQGILDMKCGNMSTKAQMEALPDNIGTFQRIEDEFGSVDAFITSAPANVIVEKISNGSSPYKMKMLGEALGWEYLRQHRTIASPKKQRTYTPLLFTTMCGINLSFAPEGILSQAARQGLSARMRFASANSIFSFAVCFRSPRYRVFLYLNCPFTTPNTCSTFALTEDFSCSRRLI